MRGDAFLPGVPPQNSEVMNIIKVCEYISEKVGLLGVVFFPALVGVCVIEVFARYVLNSPTIWAFDLTFMAHGSLFVTTGAYALQKQAHVKIDILSNKFPVKVQSGLNLVAYLFIFLPAVLLLTHATIKRTWSAYLTDEVELVSAWGPLVWPFFLILSIGLLALVLQIVAEITKNSILLAKKT